MVWSETHPVTGNQRRAGAIRGQILLAWGARTCRNAPRTPAAPAWPATRAFGARPKKHQGRTAGAEKEEAEEEEEEEDVKKGIIIIIIIIMEPSIFNFSFSTSSLS